MGVAGDRTADALAGAATSARSQDSGNDTKADLGAVFSVPLEADSQAQVLQRGEGAEAASAAHALASSCECLLLLLLLLPTSGPTTRGRWQSWPPLLGRRAQSRWARRGAPATSSAWRRPWCRRRSAGAQCTPGPPPCPAATGSTWSGSP
ncbi:unnamed protein product [Prorocentrum cordatum]|uniref:Uncharacterized protein n=1 Tax=Prorocentrum cordatum TaxID=2364126 RepID=A0ABN9SPI6_9DINO|nr:unnamed protein product [Polarella glacialis]